MVDNSKLSNHKVEDIKKAEFSPMNLKPVGINLFSLYGNLSGTPPGKGNFSN